MFKRKQLEFAWQFYEDVARQGVSRNSGISHFSGNRTSYVARECIQNSLDAAANNNKPVEVHFERETVRRTSIQARRLAETLQQCLDSGFVSPQDEGLFRHARKRLERGSALECLAIRDENTLGTSHIASRGMSGQTPWDALTRWSGVSGKRDGAMGSWGLGKNAAFAASRCRTVLYTTRYLNDTQMQMKMDSLFIAKSIFVSHEDEKGNLRNSNGYLENRNRQGGFQNDEIPTEFQRSTQGTTIRILEFPFQQGWQRDLMRNAAEHFFPALKKGRLKVFVDGIQLNLEQIIADRGDLNQQQQSLAIEPMTLTQRFVQTLARPEHSWTDTIPGIGECWFAIRLEDEQVTKTKKHALALVRGAGMFLTDQRRNMGGVVTKRFSSTTMPFTAILWCSRDRDCSSLLRDCENTRHDEISLDQISGDPKQHKRARKAFEILRTKVEETVKGFADANTDLDEESIDELASFVWRNSGKTSTKWADDDNDDDRLPALKQRPLRLPSNVISNVDSTTLKKQSTQKQSKDDRKRRKRQRSSNLGIQPTFGNLRFRIPSGTTHETVVGFDANGSNYRGLSVVAEGEDGETYIIRIVDAWQGLKTDAHALKHDGTLIESLNHRPTDGERVILHIKTQEPIEQNSLQLMQHIHTRAAQSKSTVQ